MTRLTIHLKKGEKIIEKGKKKTINTIAYIIQGRKGSKEFQKDVINKLYLHDGNVKKSYFTNVIN